jgi:hypothetical protein
LKKKQERKRRKNTKERISTGVETEADVGNRKKELKEK